MDLEMNLAVFLVGFLALVASHDLQRISIDPENHWFKDESGRVVILRGINSVMKGFPWYHTYMLEDYRIEDLESFGFNVVRLGAMWTGAEPEMGVFNHTYFEVEGAIITKLAEAGIYSMLDMHQDCITSKYDILYDGIPRWVADMYPDPENEYPWPLDEITAWEQCYITQAVCEIFQHLYNDTADTMQHWGGFWEEMARVFHEDTAVIGYNYINEPGVGDSFADRDLLVPGVAGKRNLLPSYDYLTERIRNVDPDKGLVFYEPVFYGQLFSNETIGTGFDRVPGGEGNEHLSAFSWHSYCWFLEFIDGDATDDDRQQAKERCDNWLLPKMFQSAQENVERTGGVSILTEFGICNGWDDFSWPDVWTECETFLDLADTYFESWNEWDYNDGAWYSGQNKRWGKVLPYVRPYPRATAGIPVSNFFNKTSVEYEYEFIVDASISLPTEIFVPSLRYVNGYEVEVSVNLNYEVAGDLLYLTPVDEDVAEAWLKITPVGEAVNRHNFRDYYPQ